MQAAQSASLPSSNEKGSPQQAQCGGLMSARSDQQLGHSAPVSLTFMSHAVQRGGRIKSTTPFIFDVMFAGAFIAYLYHGCLLLQAGP